MKGISHLVPNLAQWDGSRGLMCIKLHLGTKPCAHIGLITLTTFSTVAIVAWYSISWQTHETLGDCSEIFHLNIAELKSDSPVWSIIFALLLCGIILRIADRAYPRDFAVRSKREEQYLPSVLLRDQDGEIKAALSQESTTRQFSQLPSLQLLSRRQVSLIMVGCIIFRVATLSYIAGHIECTQKNIEVGYISKVKSVPVTSLSHHSTPCNWKRFHSRWSD
jgi:hypothetical protein